MPLLEGLSDVRDSVANPSLRATLGVIIQDIEQGSTLSTAMRQHPKVFDDVFVALMEAGEFSGELGHVLRNLARTFAGRATSSPRPKRRFAIRCSRFWCCCVAPTA